MVCDVALRLAIDSGLIETVKGKIYSAGDVFGQALHKLNIL